MDIVSWFDAISSAEFEKKGKPDPAVYFTTAIKLNFKPNACFAIEDSNTGMLAAKNAGMKVIAFTNGNKETNFEFADYKIIDFESFNIDLLN